MKIELTRNLEQLGRTIEAKIYGLGEMLTDKEISEIEIGEISFNNSGDRIPQVEIAKGFDAIVKAWGFDTRNDGLFREFFVEPDNEVLFFKYDYGNEKY